MLAVAGAATTIALIADAKAVDQRQVVNQPSDQSYERWRGRRDNFRTAAFVTGGITLAAAATAAVLILSDHPREEAQPFRDDEGPRKEGPQFTPMVWAGGAGVTMEGGF